jgi:hypothetical protein
MSEEHTLTVTMTEDEWSEVANAISSKIIYVETGSYGGDMTEGELHKWLDDLGNAYDKLTDILEEAGIAY